MQVFYVNGRCITCAEVELFCICEPECEHLNVNDNLIDSCADCGLVDDYDDTEN